jgi:hypothetical protein
VDNPAVARGAAAGKELLNLADQLLESIRGLRLDVERVSDKIDRASDLLPEISTTEN